MSAFKGRFVWYELMTTDTEAAKAFYSKVVGWTTQDVPMPGMTYTLLKAGEAQIAGLMPIPPDAKAMGVPPNWTGYVAVDDVDAGAAQLKGLGGSVMREPDDIPGVGRFAVVADPQGAVFCLFRGNGDGPMDPEQGTPGHVGWHELYANDLETAFAFYSAMFGWRKDAAVDMGAMGIYQTFALGDLQIGGMMTRPPNVPVCAWLYYFNVGDIDEAAGRVVAAGGKVFHGPMEVPGGWVLQGQDPQGAMFALYGSRG